MKKLRILALFHESHVPPDTREELSEKLDDRWAAFEMVAALRALGHEVVSLGVHDELLPIREAIAQLSPHIVFNQLLEFHGAAFYDAHVVSYLELLKTPYTGCNPRGLLLASDKTLAKKILTYHRIRTPRFAVVPRGRKPQVGRLRFPLFVKSAQEHASMGISQASIVTGAEALAKRVRFVHESLATDAIVEEYVEGREVTVSVLGNTRLTTLPPWELFFDALPEGTAAIATSRVKWNERYQEKLGVRNGPADLADDKARALVRIAKRAFRALEVTGYARVDFRLDAEGVPYVLEANPNPDLTPGEDFAESAERAGLHYPALLSRILSLGLSHRPAWKEG